MMELQDFLTRLAPADEHPFDHFPANGGFCSILRRIACVGDSLSSGEHESMEEGKHGYHDYFDYSWGQFLARDAGCTVFNFSKGGMTAKRYMESFGDEAGCWDTEKWAQAYIFALGVNDCSQVMEGKYELGEIGDIHPDAPEQNAPTFAGWYGQLLSRYREIEPRAKFFLMSMPSHRIDDERGVLYDRHAALLYEIAALFGNCYVLDFRKYAPNYDQKEFRERFYLGGHLNAFGYRLTALMVESYIDYIIRHNAADFREIGFVGTSHYYENQLPTKPLF